ncbi:MAG: TadE/TadG family type IV pilus assembly protein [Terriglobales bacterium]
MRRRVQFPGSRRQDWRQRSAGTSMVEFALSVSVFLTVLFGIMQLSLAMFTYHFVAGAARQAARYAMVRGAECSGWATACPAAASDIQSYVESITPGGINPAALTVTTTWLPDNTPGSEVQVTVQYAYGLDIPFVPASLWHLSSNAQMVISQ